MKEVFVKLGDTMDIIGITGFARAGKSTYAAQMQETLIAKHPHDEHRIYAFATSLKLEVADMCWRHYGVSPFTEDPKDKERIRSMLVEHAMERRAQDEDYWVRRLEGIIHRNMPATAIIADVRFENEARWVLKHGGRIVRIVRDGVRAVNDIEAKNNGLLDKYIEKTLTARNGEFVYAKKV